MRNIPYVCQDCGKHFFVKGGSDAGTNVALGGTITEFAIGGRIIKGGSVDETGSIAEHGGIVSSLMCPFCKSKNVSAGGGADSVRAILEQKSIPSDSSIYKMLDILSHLEVNWSYKNPTENIGLTDDTYKQVIAIAPIGACALERIVENRKAFNHHLLVKQEQDEQTTYYIINRSKGIVFTLSVNGDDVRFSFYGETYHTPDEIDKSMSRKLESIAEKYLNDYSCYFEIG